MNYCFIIILLLVFTNCDHLRNMQAIETTIVSQSSVLKCGLFNCPSSNGSCFGKYNESCVCLEQYASFPFDTYNLCNYEKKKQLIAFLLEFFIMFGSGHIYSENYALGILKALYFVLTCGLFISVRILSKKTEENNTFILIISLLGCLTCAGLLIWQLIDVVLFGLNRYVDGNGVELFPMTSNN